MDNTPLLSFERDDPVDSALSRVHPSAAVQSAIQFVRESPILFEAGFRMHIQFEGQGAKPLETKWLKQLNPCFLK